MPIHLAGDFKFMRSGEGFQKYMYAAKPETKRCAFKLNWMFQIIFAINGSSNVEAESIDNRLIIYLSVGFTPFAEVESYFN